MVSFGFDDGQFLAVSIETRKERSESYSALQGFFRQYELYYVFADERDVIRLRTDYRGEDVYLYHTTLTPDQAREVLLSYVRRANALKERPEFYNALTSNCATNVLDHARDGEASGRDELGDPSQRLRRPPGVSQRSAGHEHAVRAAAKRAAESTTRRSPRATT